MIDSSLILRVNDGLRGASNADAALTIQPVREAVMATKPLPSQNVLNKLLRYDAETGKLYWRPRPEADFHGARYPKQCASMWARSYAEREALSYKTPRGYLTGTIHRRPYLAHRVIWVLVHGVEPDQIDHINGDRADNRLCNLRDVGPVQNRRNMKLSANNRSGAHGVNFRRGAWECKIGVGNRNKYLGRYGTFDEAVAVRRAAEKEYDFHQNHGRTDDGIQAD